MVTKPARNKVLFLIIAAMLLANIGLLVSFVWKKEEKSSPQVSRTGGIMNDFLLQGVGFSEEQKKLADSMWAEHRKSMQPYFDELQKTKVNFFQMVSNTAPGDSSLLKAAEQIGTKQKEIELRFYTHLYQLRNICTEEQKARFDSLYPSVIQKIVSPHRNKNKKSQDSLSSK